MKRNGPNSNAKWSLERKLWSLGSTPLVGIDEAGRGALGGPVVVAAVMLPYGNYPYRDSKQVSAKQRYEWEKRIIEEALAWGIGVVEPRAIDRLNILGAAHLAAERAVARLVVSPGGLITDYLFLPSTVPVLSPPRADSISIQVAAASILAKTYRDRLLVRLARAYPGYFLESNMGYGTAEHLKAIRKHGPTSFHRHSFKPVLEANRASQYHD